MTTNLLYYYPVEANVLYNSKKNSKEYRKAVKEINPLPFNVDNFFKNDSFVNKVCRSYMVRTKIFMGYLVLFFIWLIGAWITDFEGKFFGNGVIGAVIILSAFVFDIIIMDMVVKTRNKLIGHWLETYEPVHIECDELTLLRIGLCGLRTIGNKAEIEDGVADKVEVDGGYVQSGEGDENAEICAFTDCACISCKRIIRNSEIKEFDGNNSAVCPYCGEVSLMYKTGEISPEFLEKLHIYWSAVNSLKSQE